MRPSARAARSRRTRTSRRPGARQRAARPGRARSQPPRHRALALLGRRAETLTALSEATGDRKLLRSHTAIVVGVKRDPDAQVAEEDYAATACAIENLMLAARGRGLASFWRTPGVLSRPVGREDPDVPRKVRLIGVVHLGWPGEPFPRSPSAAPPSSRAGSTRTRRAQPTSKTMPWASGSSLEPLIVAVWRRM